MIFQDRQEAGRLLAESLQHYKGKKDTIVLGLARGGIVVAYEVAKALSLPLNVLVPRKVGAPSNPELAIGAVMDSGVGVFNDAIIRLINATQGYIDEAVRKAVEVSQQRTSIYRKEIPLMDLDQKHVILVDDGIATGATMLVAIHAMREKNVAEVVVAVPVAASDTLTVVNDKANQVVCLHSEDNFNAVARFYKAFEQTENKEVIELLKKASQWKG